MASILRAVGRAKLQILSVGLTYLLSILVGAVMVHSGRPAALGFRDRLVAKAHAKDRAAMASDQGKSLEAALWDFGQNLVVGAVPLTITGLTVVSPYALAGYSGWVGGIVSVDGRHQSRLREWRKAAYYLLTLLLQLVPYSLAGGAGVKLGLTYFRPDPAYKSSRKVLGYPVEALKDVGRVYALVVPLFLIASLWEFLSPWN
jgi:Stage II sporulation protein M